ncbi:MAG: hypothetical protein MJ149_01775 [Clostridia bacterium]|nr:hypothetical protein [Clostridia bacterium]
MAKVKILKSLPKSKTKDKRKTKLIPNKVIDDKFKNNYLNFYDDVKIPGKRYDW